MYDGALDYLCSCFYQFTYGLLLLLLSAVMVADSNSCSVLASCATVQSASSSVIPHLVVWGCQVVLMTVMLSKDANSSD
ncbi:hypothetical protein RHGRI_020829 [Rhododendron griersonianum]|uniref:Uncharacterized protein n=1 Tax=Rhododendron griersonianum TaxID=479676 RepID=A0AAV6JLQ2_9ERIC|nr:hypothetical protein RHGRI_020829 [Rhododendron griersonianum]